MVLLLHLECVSLVLLHIVITATSVTCFTTPNNLFHRKILDKNVPLSPSSSSSSLVLSTSLTLSSSKKDTNNNTIDDEILKEVELLRKRAKELRDSIPEAKSTANKSQSECTNDTSPRQSKTEVEMESKLYNNNSVAYRLNIDIGREEGTWMDPRWGASGKRIEFTIDVLFLIPPSSSPPTSSSFEKTKNDEIDEIELVNVEDISTANQNIIDEMVKDNLSGQSSIVRNIKAISNKARLRNGFDSMKVNDGGYRIDIQSNKGSNTIRFYLNVDGTEREESYGDIFIPEGNLYFSLPCFGTNPRSLSSKEGIVTVRQTGWHTGWRREESRIVGVFRAVPLDQAKKRRGF